MKKLLSVLLAISLVLSLGMISSAAEDYAVMFEDAIDGDTEQGPVWYYLFDAGNGYEELTQDHPYPPSWQYSSNPDGIRVYYSIFDQDQLSDVQRGYRAWAGSYLLNSIKMVVGWKAYKSGTVRINEWNFTAHEYSDTEMTVVATGGEVTVLHNDLILYSGTVVEDESANVYEGQEFQVNTGDMIYFVMDGENANDASFRLDTLSVEYLESQDQTQEETQVTPGDEILIIVSLIGISLIAIVSVIFTSKRMLIK